MLVHVGAAMKGLVCALALLVLVAACDNGSGSNAKKSTVSRTSAHIPRCPALTGTSILPKGLHLSLRLDHPAVRAVGSTGGEIGAELRVRNDGPNPFAMDPGQPLIAAIVKPGTRRVLGRYTGLVAGTGWVVNLSRGQHAAIQVLVAAWRCDRGLRRSALPPGIYGVRAGIGPNEGPPLYLAPEVPLRITR
jgi:hypothetical protein